MILFHILSWLTIDCEIDFVSDTPHKSQCFCCGHCQVQMCDEFHILPSSHYWMWKAADLSEKSIELQYKCTLYTRRTEKMNLQRKVSPSLRVCLVGTHLGLFLCESKRLWCTGVPAVCFILLIWLLCFVIVSVTRRSRSDVGHWVSVSRLDWCDPGEWWYLVRTWLMLL